MCELKPFSHSDMVIALSLSYEYRDYTYNNHMADMPTAEF